MNDLYVKLCNIFVRMTVMDWPLSAFQILYELARRVLCNMLIFGKPGKPVKI